MNFVGLDLFLVWPSADGRRMLVLVFVPFGCLNLLDTLDRSECDKLRAHRNGFLVLPLFAFVWRLNCRSCAVEADMKQMLPLRDDDGTLLI